jgi:hypothetical protein
MGMLGDLKLDMEVASLPILLNNVLGSVGSMNCSHTVCINTQFAPPFFSIFKTYNFGSKFLLSPTSKSSESCDFHKLLERMQIQRVWGFGTKT